MQAEGKKQPVVFVPGSQPVFLDESKSGSASDFQVLVVVITATLTFICGVCLGWISASSAGDHSNSQTTYGRFGHMDGAVPNPQPRSK